jgi:spore coat polysaccharide biosynthesis protein SpsF
MNGAIILSRMDSVRFPGKALAKIHGKTLLEWCVEGLRGHGFSIVIATSDRPVDNPVEDLALSNGIGIFRGNADNVALRLYDCAMNFGFDAFARVNGDSPLVRGALIGQAFQMLEHTGCGFVTNLLNRTYPYGIAAEVVNTGFYGRILSRIVNSNHREHPTSVLYETLSFPDIQSLPDATTDECGTAVRLVVDYPEDLEVIEQIISAVNGEVSSLEISKMLNIYRHILSKSGM